MLAVYRYLATGLLYALIARLYIMCSSIGLPRLSQNNLVSNILNSKQKLTPAQDMPGPHKQQKFQQIYNHHDHILLSPALLFLTFVF